MTTPASTRLPVPAGLQMTLHMTTAGQRAAVVLGARRLPAWNGQSSALAWRNEAWANFRGLMIDDVVCTGATVRTVSGDPDEVYDLAGPPSPTGFVTGTPGLLAACTLVKWGTATGGRSGKGRTFFPGLAFDALNADGRTIKDSVVSTFVPYVTSYLSSSALSTAGVKPAVLSFRKGASYDITTANVQTLVGIQRRRMR